MGTPAVIPAWRMRPAQKPAIDYHGPLDRRAVAWFSPYYGTGDGYGASAEAMILGLEAAGMRVSLAGGRVCGQESRIGKFAARPPAGNAAAKVAYSPPTDPIWLRDRPDQALLGFTMWEDDSLPRSWDPFYARIDALATPSRFCVELFKCRFAELGLDIPICYVPLGVDAERYPFVRRTHERGRGNFRVLWNATAIYDTRKGAAEAVAAFQLAFPGRTDVELLLRSRYDGAHGIEGDDPRIRVVRRMITDEAKRRMLERAHVLLYPSKGEGFGLIPLEAIASGLPAIVAANSSMLDYRELTFPIRCTPGPSQISPPWRQAPAGACWGEPDVAHAAEQLREIEAAYDAAAAFAARAAVAVRGDWTYERTVDALQDALALARLRAESRCARRNAGLGCVLCSGSITSPGPCAGRCQSAGNMTF